METELQKDWERPQLQRTNISSGFHLEPVIGSSRAVRIGQHIAVAATAAVGPDGTAACKGDVHGQTRRCLEIIARAIAEAGGCLEDVIRTRQ